jgi:DNA-binding response OmpR family regulator
VELGYVLVVDDSETIRCSLKAHLSERGFAVDAVSDVPQARDFARKRRPDVLLTDLFLEQGSGLDLIRYMHETYGARARPGCILMTGHASLESAIEAIRSGADEYLMKPVDLKDLDSSVSALAGRHALGLKPLEPGAAEEALGRIVTPLATLRAHLEMLGEGRFGPLTEQQEEKLARARESLRRISALVHGAGTPARPLPVNRRLTRNEINQMLAATFDAWAEDFERRGAQIAWNQAPEGANVSGDLVEMRREIDEYLAVCLSRASVGQTLRLDWQAYDDWLTSAIYLDPEPEVPAFATATPSRLRLALKPAD